MGHRIRRGAAHFGGSQERCVCHRLQQPLRVTQQGSCALDHLCPESFRMAYASSFPCFFVVVWNREKHSQSPLSLSAGLGHCRVTGVVITMGPFVTLSHSRSPCPFISLSLPSFSLALSFSLSETRLPQAPLTRPANCGVLKQESVSTRLEGTQQKSYVCILTAFTLVSAVYLKMIILCSFTVVPNLLQEICPGMRHTETMTFDVIDFKPGTMCLDMFRCMWT